MTRREFVQDSTTAAAGIALGLREPPDSNDTAQ
jgi:hypothetical protein